MTQAEIQRLYFLGRRGFGWSFSTKSVSHSMSYHFRVRPAFTAGVMRRGTEGTPAMEAGLTDPLHDMDWLVDLVDAAPKPNRPAPYRKRAD